VEVKVGEAEEMRRKGVEELEMALEGKGKAGEGEGEEVGVDAGRASAEGAKMLEVVEGAKVLEVAEGGGDGGGQAGDEGAMEVDEVDAVV
jgi:hypothetical protein